MSGSDEEASQYHQPRRSSAAVKRGGFSEIVLICFVEIELVIVVGLGMISSAPQSLRDDIALRYEPESHSNWIAGSHNNHYYDDPLPSVVVLRMSRY